MPFKKSLPEWSLELCIPLQEESFSSNSLRNKDVVVKEKEFFSEWMPTELSVPVPNLN